MKPPAAIARIRAVLTSGRPISDEDMARARAALSSAETCTAKAGELRAEAARLLEASERHLADCERILTGKSS